MKKVLKWGGIVLCGLIAVCVVAVMGLYAGTRIRLSRTYTIQPKQISIPTDQESVLRGRRLVSIFCTSCHGEKLQGTDFFDDPGLGHIETQNLTSGKGGVGGGYGDADWVRAIRHGVRPNGKPIMIMPSKGYYYFSDNDLGDIIAYVKSAPPADSNKGGHRMTVLAHVLVALGAFGNIIHAEVIDHATPPPPAPPSGPTAAYGNYLIKVMDCRTCHGEDLSGGKDPNPKAPPAPNITPGGATRDWTDADFITVVRGRQSEFMPWRDMSLMTDEELKAIWLYLKSLPAKSRPAP